MELLEKGEWHFSQLPWKCDHEHHSLHSLCSRICSFPPSLVKHFILSYSNENEIIFDPFSGKGTLPLEALIRNRIGWGNDISPEAYILTKAKTCKIDPSGLFRFLDSIKEDVKLPNNLGSVDSSIKIFYNDHTLKQIIGLRDFLIERKDKYSIFVKALILGILHGSSSNSLSLRCSHSYSMSPNYVRKYSIEHKLIKPKKDVFECIKEKAISCLKDGIPNIKGKAFDYDSRKLKIKTNTVNLIITSPPYFAVQTYAYDNWLRLWFLGCNYKDIHKLQVNTNSEEKYAEFMYDSFKEMHRVLKNDSMCFVIVGDVKKKYSIKGKELIKIINTAKFLSVEAKKAGFEVLNIIEDNIPQGRKVLNSSLSGKGINKERILCLRKENLR